MVPSVNLSWELCFWIAGGNYSYSIYMLLHFFGLRGCNFFLSTISSLVTPLPFLQVDGWKSFLFLFFFEKKFLTKGDLKRGAPKYGNKCSWIEQGRQAIHPQELEESTSSSTFWNTKNNCQMLAVCVTIVPWDKEIGNCKYFFSQDDVSFIRLGPWGAPEMLKARFTWRAVDW